jgi:CBS domain containing-hemolysin-like protein
MEIQSLLISILLLSIPVVFANGFFVSIEFALVSVRRSRIEQLATQGKASAQLVLKLLNQNDRILAAAQLGITVASLALGSLEEQFSELFLRLAEILHIPMSEGVSHVFTYVLAIIVLSYVHLVFGEQAPKIFAIRRPEAVAMLTARPILFFERIFRPFIWGIDASTRLVLRPLGIKESSEHHQMYSLDELKYFISQSQKRGLLAEEQEAMALGAIELATKDAKSVMIPRSRIVSIDENAKVQEFLKIFAQHPHARFPVHRMTTDNISGYVRIKDILMALANQPGAFELPLRTFVKPTIFAPENKRVGDLFVEMRDKRVQLAVVVEEFGGTAGIITLEEMAEEVVGRVGEALMHEPATYHIVSENVLEISGQMKISELNRRMRVRLPDRSEYETVAGFLLYELRAVPSVGAKLVYEGLQFTVTEVQGARVAKVKIDRQN